MLVCDSLRRGAATVQPAHLRRQVGVEDVQVYARRGDVGVAEHTLHVGQTEAPAQQFARARMAQRVRVEPERNASALAQPIASLARSPDCELLRRRLDVNMGTRPDRGQSRRQMNAQVCLLPPDVGYVFRLDSILIHQPRIVARIIHAEFGGAAAPRSGNAPAAQSARKLPQPPFGAASPPLQSAA